VPDLPAPTLIYGTKEVCSKHIQGAKADALYQISPEFRLSNSEILDPLSPNNHCTKFMDKIEHSQSVDLDLSEFDMDLPWSINSNDIKKIFEEFSLACEGYDAIEIKEEV